MEKKQNDYVRNFLDNIPCWSTPMTTICIHYDSQFAFGRTQNIIYNGKFGHIN